MSGRVSPGSWTSWYWPAALALALAVIMVPEVWALATRHYQDTLSDWVWRQLRVSGHQPVSQWSAARVLVLGEWLVLVTWLTWHLFLRWWR